MMSTASAGRGTVQVSTVAATTAMVRLVTLLTRFDRDAGCLRCDSVCHDGQRAGSSGDGRRNVEHRRNDVVRADAHVTLIVRASVNDGSRCSVGYSDERIVRRLRVVVAVEVRLREPVETPARGLVRAPSSKRLRNLHDDRGDAGHYLMVAGVDLDVAGAVVLENLT